MPKSGECKVNDMLKSASRTYRQLRTWENRAGVTASERVTSKGWRKFSLEEVLALAVCATIHSKLSLPLEKVRSLYKELLGDDTYIQEDAPNTPDELKSNEQFIDLLKLEKASFLQAVQNNKEGRNPIDECVKAMIRLKSDRPIVQAIKLIAWCGLPIYLVGLGSMVLTEYELVDFIGSRSLLSLVTLCRLNNIIREVLTGLQGQPLKSAKRYKALTIYLDELKKNASITKSERKVIRLIREQKYLCVTVHIRGSKIIRADTYEASSSTERSGIEKEILELIGSKGYQTVTLIEQDGKVVSLSRKTQILLE